MGDPITAKAQDPQDPEPSISELYDDDFSQEGTLITSLELVPSITGELASGSPRDRDTDPTSATEEGSTYAEIISHARVRAALKRPIRLCKYQSVPACLLALEINLIETNQTRQLPRLLRFKSVDVTLEFKPLPPSPAGPKPSPKQPSPEVVLFCPDSYSGAPTIVTYSHSTTVGASLDSSSALPAGLRLGAHHTSHAQYRKASACTITGRTLLFGASARMVKWEINEDAALKTGVPRSVRLVVALANPGQGPFNVKLDFSAHLGFGDVLFRVGKAQGVMATKVDPAALRELAANHELGEAFGRVAQCAVDEEEVVAVDLERLTNLKGATVGRTHGLS